VLGKLGVTNLRDAAAIAARHYHVLGDADAAATLSRGSDVVVRDVAGPADAEGANVGLTPRELSVLYQLFQGHSDREIAAQLFISRRTASKHVEAILSKLGVRSRGAAVAEAGRLGMAPPSSTDQTE
jgi:DNA-binding NarL/FixJ family response regulator